MALPTEVSRLGLTVRSQHGTYRGGLASRATSEIRTYIRHLQKRKIWTYLQIKHLRMWKPRFFTFLLLQLKPSAQAQGGKQSLKNAFATPQASLPRKTQENTTQGSNQRLAAPFNHSSVPVSNTVLGRSFHIRTWAGRKYLANLHVLLRLFN